MNGFYGAYPDKPMDPGLRMFRAEVLQESLVAARPQLPAWNDQLARARKPLDDMKGNLRGQLDLFFDPKFDVRVTTLFFDDLGQQHGVTETAIRDFLNSARLLRDGAHFMDHPIGPIDEPSLNAVLKLRAEEQFQKSHSDMERFRDEILRQVAAHAATAPATQSATRP